MNFVCGKVVKANGLKFISDNNEFIIVLSNSQEKLLQNYTDKRVWLGIRPEDIYDSSTKPNSETLHQHEVLLEVVEPMGNEIFLYFQLEGTQFTSRIPAREKPKVGVKETLYFDTNKMHFFEHESEKAIIFT
jgi:multiple sugar transport system ATP-binding protein